MRPSVVLVVAALTLAACRHGTGDAEAITDAPEPVDAAPAENEPQPPPRDDPTPPPCQVPRLEASEVVDLRGDDAVELSIEVARRTHSCGDVAVVAPADGGVAVLLAVPVALALDAPLLLWPPGPVDRLVAALDEFAATEVVAVGTTPPLPDHEVTTVLGDDRHDGLPREIALALAVADYLDAGRVVAVRLDDPLAAAAAATSLPDGAALLPVPNDADLLASLAEALPATVAIEAAGRDAADAAALANRLLAFGLDARPSELQPAHGPPWANGGSTSWLVDPGSSGLVAVATAAALPRGDAVLPVDRDDLRAGRQDTERLLEAAPDRVVLLGDLTDEAEWQLPLVLHGRSLPGGGFRLFENQRIVALYGNPDRPALGALGQQDLDETVERLREAAEPYGADGVEVLPAFEIIVTVASGHPEPTGDYSARTPIDRLRPWIDRAAEEGFYVILDLQPGRTDFLSQAIEYEELLTEPHVGLAIDPEWRLEDDQVHLQQVGSVEAAEVQEVLDWLAERTREQRLPQKLVVLHQFLPQMLPDRDTLEVPPELSVVVHMDGHGPAATKDATYSTITAGAEDGWLWGWKNFYVQDDPIRLPEDVLDLDPRPVFVSYQ